MSDNGQQVPLIDRLQRVPAAARVLEHTPNPLGCDTTSIPVGALCQEAADRIAELEAALAAERERREAADKILRDIRNRGVGGWVTSAIDAHFARYEKD